jgi:cytoskeletal protein RodZ
MARKGGIFQAMGNLIRWTVFGLAAILVVAIVLNVTSEDDPVVADSGTATEPAPSAEENAAAEVAAEAEAAAGEAQEELDEAAETLEQATEEVAEAATEAAEDAATVAEAVVQEAAEDAAAAVEEAEVAAEAALDEANATLTEGAESAASAAQETLEGIAAEGAMTEEEADLNILPTDIETFTIPGDEATYALQSVFQRDDGTIEVVTDRTADGATLQTTRLVTCAPLAVGVVQEGTGERNDAPELERIPLGTAAASIAALACGIMN